MKLFKVFNTFSFLFYFVNFASADEFGEKLSFWNKGFNVKAYQKCQKKLSRCPKNGPLKDKSCTEKLIGKTKSCQQLSDLSNWFAVPANSIELKPYKKFTLVKINYIADGQTESYLITPQGMLYKSNIDVRKINKQIRDEFKDYDFMISNWGNWKTQDHNKEYQFQILQKVTNACLACPVLLWTVVNFYFSQEGKFMCVTANKVKAPKQ